MSEIYLYIDGFPVLASKDWVNPYAMLLFTEEDKKIFDRKLKDRPYFVGWNIDEKKEQDAEHSETVYQYCTTVKTAIERLNILGFTNVKVEGGFKETLKHTINSIKGSILDSNPPAWNEFKKKESQMLKNSNFESFKKAFQEIKENKITAHKYELPPLSDLAKFLLRQSYDWRFRYPDQHPLHYLRFMLECCDIEAKVILDFTDLVRSGFATKEANIRDISIKNTSRDHEVFSKILVLTEGESDANILKIALEKLYPDLSNYYLFMPFHLTEISPDRKIPGSAQALLQRIKSFAACQINNRIIGVFDNDYEGRKALEQIGRGELPDNIKLISYPDIEANKEYPISNGNYKDINGKAAFLETYFGSQVMKAVAQEKPEIIVFNEKKGKIAITWKEVKVKDNNSQVGLFNELTHKDKKQDKNEEIKQALQKKMQAMLKQNNDLSDWSDIKTIFESIFHCFQE